MSYANEAHMIRFVEAVETLYGGEVDNEYGAALFILTSTERLWNKAKGYITHHGIQFPTMLEEVDFSGGYTVLVKLAGNLFNGNTTHIDTVELMRLDEGNFELALSAIRVRRYGISI